MNLVSEFYGEREPLRRLVRSLAGDSRAHVLDIGCLKGDVSRALARRVGRLVALDTLPYDEWQRHDHNMDFVCGDALSLPFRSGSFDTVVACECLQYIRNPEVAIDEFSRVLKPGGVLVMSFPQGGVVSTYLDPYNVINTVKKMIAPRATRGQVVRHHRSDRILEGCRSGWRRISADRRGTMVFIYTAWFIDKLQFLRLELGAGRWLSRRAILPLIRCLFHVMKADFRLSLSRLSYNNIIKLEKIGP